MSFGGSIAFPYIPLPILSGSDASQRKSISRYIVLVSPSGPPKRSCLTLRAGVPGNMVYGKWAECRESSTYVLR